jgi:cytochrome c5
MRYSLQSSILTVAHAVFAAAQSASDAGLPQGEGREVVARVCTTCHSSAVFAANPGGLTHWNLVAAQMIPKSAKITGQEFAQIVEYLAAQFGPVQVRTTLPADPGKETLERVCGDCHTPELVSDRQGDAETWSRTINSMVNRGARASPAEIAEMVAYLTAHFGPDVRGLPIQLNQYTAKQLELSLEIPAKEAEAIVAYRDTHGRIKSWEDLIHIPGVDPLKLGLKRERIRY